MSWRWDELTAKEFPKAVAEAKETCLLPIGCLEKHGDHLPLGTDVFAGDGLAARAIEKEPAILMPPYCFGHIHEAKHRHGAIALRREVLMDLTENFCDEIARNGLKKIIILNAHGGNEGFLQFFSRTMLERKREYTLYVILLQHFMLPVVRTPQWKDMVTNAPGGHADEMETSLMLALRPELVKMKDLAEPAPALERLAHIPNVMTAMNWYANYPEHYAGNAVDATEEKGRFLVDGFVNQIAAIIKSVKEDRVTRQLEDEFFSAQEH